jgi:hypothetical protein
MCNISKWSLIFRPESCFIFINKGVQNAWDFRQKRTILILCPEQRHHDTRSLMYGIEHIKVQSLPVHMRDISKFIYKAIFVFTETLK